MKITEEKQRKILGISSIAFFIMSLIGLLFMFVFISKIADQPETVEFGQDDRELNLLTNPPGENTISPTPEVSGE